MILHFIEHKSEKLVSRSTNFMEIDKNIYSNSKETMKNLKVSSCELMHLRVSGKLRFMKKGNSYFYKKDSFNGDNKK